MRACFLGADGPGDIAERFTVASNARVQGSENFTDVCGVDLCLSLDLHNTTHGRGVATLAYMAFVVQWLGKEPVAIGNALVGQSGGPTAVINQTLIGVIEAATKG